MKKSGLAIIIAAFFILTGQAFAGTGERAGWLGPFNPDLLSRLELSDEQLPKVQSLRDGLVQKVVPLRNSLSEIKGELKDLWIQSQPDESKIREKQKEVRSLRDQIKDKIMNYSLELKKLLTPEQNSRLAALWLEWGRGMGNGKSSMKDPSMGQ